MTALIIIASIIAFIISIIVLVSYSRRKTMKNWKVGDKLKMDVFSQIGKSMQHNDIKHATLLAWSSPSEILIKVKGRVHKTKYGEIDENLSCDLRRMEERIRKTMNQPDFDIDKLIQNTDNSSENSFCDGIPIETMSETQCEVYLKKALKSQEFEIAAEIRERLKRFR